MEIIINFKRRKIKFDFGNIFWIKPKCWKISWFYRQQFAPRKYHNHVLTKRIVGWLWFRMITFKEPSSKQLHDIKQKYLEKKKVNKNEREN